MLHNDNILSVELKLKERSTKKITWLKKKLLVWGINRLLNHEPGIFHTYDQMASLRHSVSQIKIVVQFEIQNNKILSPQENQ